MRNRTLMVVLAAICALLIPLTPGELRPVPVVAGLVASAWAVALSLRDPVRGRSLLGAKRAGFRDPSLEDALTMLRPPPRRPLSSRTQPPR